MHQYYKTHVLMHLAIMSKRVVTNHSIPIPYNAK
jgi:hypothetical protein